MKKAKLKDLMLQAKLAHSKKSQALKAVSKQANEAKQKLARSKEAFKLARKEHKDARKHFRNLQRKLEISQVDLKESVKHLSKLEKKWRKLNKSTQNPGRSQLQSSRSRKSRKANLKIASQQESSGAN